MYKNTVVILLLVLAFTLIRAQVQDNLIFETNPTKDVAGPFDVFAANNISGTGPFSPGCSFVSTLAFSALPGAIYASGCGPFDTVQKVHNCTLQPILSNDTASIHYYDVFNGSFEIQSVCSGTPFNITFQCNGIDIPIQKSFLSTLDASDLSVSLTTDADLGNATVGNVTLYNVPVFDFDNVNKTLLTAYATITNIGQCQATGVDCLMNIPSRGDPAVPSSGLITFISENSTVRDNGCALVENQIICPFNILPLSGNITVKIAVTLLHNGNLTYTLDCNATNLVSPASASLTVFGINVPPPAESNSSSLLPPSSSSSLIINTVIPLAVFGGTMLIICCIIILTVGIYLFVKKVIFSEESVGF